MEKPRDVAVPVNARESRMHVTVTRRLLDKLASARDALSHSKPGATDAEILETGLDLILAAAEKRKGIVARPRKVQRPAKRTTIPAAVKREVWKRDQGRCQYRLPSGEICGSTCRLEFDHVVPLALGGESTVDQIRLLCRPHNESEARRTLGDAVMDRYVGRGRKGDRVSEEVAGWGCTASAPGSRLGEGRWATPVATLGSSPPTDSPAARRSQPESPRFDPRPLPGAHVTFRARFLP